MKTRLSMLFVAGMVLTSALPSNARAQVSVDVGADLVSSYAWRGFLLADAFAIQPSVTFGFGESGLSLNVWGSAALQDRDIYDGADELDFTLNYDVGLSETVGLSLGYIQYTFPNGGDDAKTSEEVYAGLSLDHTLAPSVTAYYDFGLMDGLYVEFGVAPEVALDEAGNTILGLGAALGMSDYTGDFGFNAALFSASLGFDLDGFSLSPFLGYSYADDEIKLDNSEFWGGLSFGISF